MSHGKAVCYAWGHRASGHGKTTLARAMSHVFHGVAANAPDSVEFESDKCHCTLIDCPNAPDAVGKMLEGVNFAILVVSVVDGMDSQTREHVALAQQSGVRAIVVFLNKMDFADEDTMVDLAELEIRELLLELGYGNCSEDEIVRGAANDALQGDESYVPRIKHLARVIDVWGTN